ncbi:DUF342 domain-containing protein [Tumebacillus flagellatus]|uniref:Flagellar Assembly Protein A N-terminal region domain-containing protein n=1 Tax=Tumebacillus flagellatus TaxID=1157490 RepID=A0A074LSY4_9BACL|nr:FapA family protein [Tumebacillus flagellatus]KEO82958.1 hypothetical protein EL26_12745 [Tumebacillus flagellatus]
MATRQEEMSWWAKNSKVTIEQGGLTASLSLSEALLQEQELPALTYDCLVEHLRQNGVSYGVDMVSCQQIVMNPRGFIGGKSKVATGKEPINGENATIEILINNEHEQSPRMLEDGRVDFYNLGVVNTVTKGQILARKKPATEGIQGVGVGGAALMAKPGRDVRLPNGKNTTIAEDGFTLLAEVDGHVSYNPRESKINVFDVFEVKGDVDFAVGNIEFLGNVKINGSVLPGFKVVAAGDIEVAGFVDGAILEAGGDVLIRGGVQMRSKGLIKASGTVRSRFMQGANVEAGVDVIVRDSIMHCHISAGRHVLMEAQKSVIVGGLVRAGEEVRTRTLGSPMATPSEVEVGVHPHLRTEIQELQARLKELYLHMDKTKKALALLENMAGVGNQLPPEKEALRQNLTHTYEHYQHEEEELMYRRSEIEVILLDTRNAKVFVTEVAYAGVKLTLGQQVTYLRDPQRGPIVYGISDGEVSTSRF